MSAIQMLLGRTASGPTTWNLFTSSAPAGLNYYPDQSTLQTAFSATYGYQTAGDASGSVYELQTAATYTGDHLFECSVLITDTCSDPSIAIFNVNAATPQWQWGANPTRIALQCNCTTPYLYGLTATSDSAGTLPFAPGYYATLHLSHEPSLTRTRAWVTSGQNDWTSSGTQIGSTMQISENYGSTPIYCGIASDFDGASISPTSTNFSAIRVTKL